MGLLARPWSPRTLDAHRWCPQGHHMGHSCSPRLLSHPREQLSMGLTYLHPKFASHILPGESLLCIARESILLKINCFELMECILYYLTYCSQYIC